MLKIKYEKQFKKDYKLIMKRGYEIQYLRKAVEYLMIEKPLPKNYKDHELKGIYVNFRECHIKNDWLLIYRVDYKELVLYLARTGTHADLFE